MASRSGDGVDVCAEVLNEWRSEIDSAALAGLAEYFRFRWDPLVLAELAGHPSRFRALATGLQTRLGEHIDDNALSRSLRRLTRHGLVTADLVQIGRRAFNVYRLTARGRQHVTAYAALITAYRHGDMPPGGGCTGCCLHGPQQTPRAV